MFHAVMLFGALRVVKTVQGADKVTCNTADALKLYAFAYKNVFIRYADTFQFLLPGVDSGLAQSPLQKRKAVTMTSQFSSMMRLSP